MACAVPVVLVGDDAPLLRTLVIGLRARGYEATVPPSLGNVPSDTVGGAPVVVVVMGSSARELDILRELRRRRARAVMALSVHHDELHRDRAIEAGAGEFLAVPFSMEELVRLIDRLSPLAGAAPALS